MTASPIRDRSPLLVVGAGIQGLTFAAEAARRGRSVLVIERSAAVGGQARSFRYGGFTFDFGLHAFVSRNLRVTALVRDLLGGDYRSFSPRAATYFGRGAVLGDDSRWLCGGAERALYSLLGEAPQQWNCMRVSKPQPIVYPRRGGFGRLAEGLKKRVEAGGGRVLLRASLGAADFRCRGGRLASVRLGGRWRDISGCYWSAGTRLLSPEAAQESPPRRAFLLFYHFLLRGRPPLPYHWVRWTGDKAFLSPPLIYYPARFSESNAPKGHYGVGAVAALPPSEDVEPGLAAMAAWAKAEPLAFAPHVARELARAGLLDPAAAIGVRCESLAAPLERGRRSAAHPLEGAPNFWDSDRWFVDEPWESGVPLQMEAALRAAESVLA